MAARPHLRQFHGRQLEDCIYGTWYFNDFISWDLIRYQPEPLSAAMTSKACLHSVALDTRNFNQASGNWVTDKTWHVFDNEGDGLTSLDKEFRLRYVRAAALMAEADPTSASQPPSAPEIEALLAMTSPKAPAKRKSSCCSCVKSNF